MLNNIQIKMIEAVSPAVPIPLIIFTEYRPTLGRQFTDVYTQVLAFNADENFDIESMDVEQMRLLAERLDLTVRELHGYLFALKEAQLIEYYNPKDGLFVIDILPPPPLQPFILKQKLLAARHIERSVARVLVSRL